jgi:tRNA threonylcarbamoyladenosine modification (KEOPS) complex Cgi121 subunit
MMNTNVLEFTLFPGRTLRLALYRDVSNGAELARRVATGACAAGPSYINARMLAGTIQVRAAATKALHAEKHGKLKTHSLHSELVYMLHPSRNIKHALQTAGVETGEPTAKEKAAAAKAAAATAAGATVAAAPAATATTTTTQEAPVPAAAWLLVAAFDADAAAMERHCEAVVGTCCSTEGVIAALDAQRDPRTVAAIVKRWKLHVVEAGVDSAAVLADAVVTRMATCDLR